MEIRVISKIAVMIKTANSEYVARKAHQQIISVHVARWLEEKMKEVI